jgi:hypothetical protein
MMVCAVVSVFLAVLIVSSAVVVAILDWAGHLPTSERLALNAVAAGLLWTSPAWLNGHRLVSVGDTLFLAGVTLLMVARYWRAVARHFGQDDPFEMVRWGSGR